MHVRVSSRTDITFLIARARRVGLDRESKIYLAHTVSRVVGAVAEQGARSRLVRYQEVSRGGGLAVQLFGAHSNLPWYMVLWRRREMKGPAGCMAGLESIRRRRERLMRVRERYCGSVNLA